MKKVLFAMFISIFSINITLASGCEVTIGDGTKTGDEIKCGEEYFNVISNDGETLTLLAKYTLGKDYIQSTTANPVSFSNSIGWEHSPGPKEVDIELYEGNAKTYITNYVNYLKEIIEDENITGTLITMTGLKELGCTIPEDYSRKNGVTCVNSENISWLANGQYWWTRSAVQNSTNCLWGVANNGTFGLEYYNGASVVGIRPIIKLSSNTITKK